MCTRRPMFRSGALSNRSAHPHFRDMVGSWQPPSLPAGHRLPLHNADPDAAGHTAFFFSSQTSGSGSRNAAHRMSAVSLGSPDPHNRLSSSVPQVTHRLCARRCAAGPPLHAMAAAGALRALPRRAPAAWRRFCAAGLVAPPLKAPPAPHHKPRGQKPPISWSRPGV